MLVVPASDAPVVITPLMESEMVGAMTWVENIRTWEDAGENSWCGALSQSLGNKPAEIWIEPSIPAQPACQTVGGQVTGSRFTDEIPWL